VPSVTTVSLDRGVAKGGVASWILARVRAQLGVVSAARKQLVAGHEVVTGNRILYAGRSGWPAISYL
jgi:hypothetical protein